MEFGLFASSFRRLIDKLAAMGMDAAVLLETSGVSPDVVDDPDAFVDYRALGRAMELGRQTFGPEFGLRVGQIIPKRRAAMSYLAAHSATVGDAVRQVARYRGLINNFTGLEIIDPVGDEPVRILQTRKVPLPPYEDEMGAAIMHTRVATELGRPPLLGVRFAHAAQCDPAIYREVLQCPVRFEQPESAMLIAQSTWATPLKKPDPDLLVLLEAQAAQKLAKLPKAEGTVAKVRLQVLAALSNGAPSIDDVAKQLALSRRSLQRRLGDEGSVFQDIVDEVRQQLAKDYLHARRHCVAEIAQMLGYSEASAFNRAFKRWTGQTPRQFRTSAPQPHAP